jgi:hypothetical protein
MAGGCIDIDVKPEKLFNTYPISDICRAADQAKTPVYLMGLAVSALKQYFGTSDRISLSPDQYLWTSDDAASQIFIAEDFNLDFKQIGKRPALICSVENFEYPIFTTAQQNLESYNPKTGTLNFAQPVNGGWTIHILSPSHLEAWSLAYEVKAFFQSYSLIMIQNFNFHRILCSAIRKPQQEEEYQKLYHAVVMVQFNFVDYWGITREALKIKSIETTLKPT